MAWFAHFMDGSEGLASTAFFSLFCQFLEGMGLIFGIYGKNWPKTMFQPLKNIFFDLAIFGDFRLKNFFFLRLKKLFSGEKKFFISSGGKLLFSRGKLLFSRYEVLSS